MYYINTFFVYSIMGFLLESFIYKLLDSCNHSGFLYGPITIIYGIGAVIIFLLERKIIDKIKVKGVLKIILRFILFMIVLTFIEFLGGIILKNVFNIELWNYDNKKYNIGKYICLDLAIVWGLIGSIYIYVIRKHIDKFINLIPKKYTYCFLVIFLIDLIVVIFNKILI